MLRYTGDIYLNDSGTMCVRCARNIVVWSRACCFISIESEQTMQWNRLHAVSETEKH